MTIPKRLRTVLVPALAAAVLSLTACGGGGSDGDSASSSQEKSGDADAAAGADLEGVPDVVAEVNGEEITKDEFAPIYQAQLQQATAQAQAGGEQPDEEALQKQTVDNLINTELLSQEAESRGIEVTDQDVDDELAKLAEQNQLGSAEELLKALDDQGTTEDQARAQIETQVMVERLVDDEVGSADISEKQLRSLYRQAKQQAQQQAQAGQPQEIPPFEKVRTQLQERAESDRVGTVAQSLIEDLRKDADIVNNL
ncbi:SurA N-terminal domain-containing protein [Nocardioides sp. P5_C9_2]